MKVHEWARRRSGAEASAELQRGHEFVEEEARRVHLPTAWSRGVESFYDYLQGTEGARTCSGTACHFARATASEGAHAHCLGRCYEAPARSDEDPGPIPRRSLVPSPVVLRHLIGGARPDPELEYRSVHDGPAVLDAVAAAGLRGRGGAAFPTASKWRLARDTPAPDRYVVANGDEGDPGAFVDRLLLEEDPHAVLAGMLGCARAIVAQRGVVFIRREYPQALPLVHGRTLPKMYEAMRSGQIAGMFILGEDVVQTDPDSNQVVADLRRLELLVVQELFLTPTAELAQVVLPGASFLEKEGTFTNGERRIQRVRQALAPLGQVRPDWQTLCDLMAATGYPQSYAHPAEIMAEIAQIAPAFTGVSYERLEGDGLQWPVPDATHPGTPLLHQQEFPLGKAPLLRVGYDPSPSLAAGDAPLLLVTGRALEHYNNGSMTRRTDNRLLLPEDRLDIHPDDARRLEIASGDRVTVTSKFGEARATARLTEDVAPGTLFLTFHFPETGTNCVTSNVVDRIADTPEYKLTAVNVRRVAAAEPAADTVVPSRR